MVRRKVPSAITSPFLRDIKLREDRDVPRSHPFDVLAIARGLPLELTTPVTFLVGENGSGKSTLLEAIGWAIGFSAEGGNRTNAYVDDADGHALGRALALSWSKRVTDGFFLRAETFFNFSRYLEEAGSDFRRYGGVPLSEQSHGEGFVALFQNRFEAGIYLLDEPEAALSPARQLAFLTVLHELASSGQAQLLIATHSPILLSLPGARVLALDAEGITEVDYRETEHFTLTRDFLNAPEQFLRHLLDDDASS
jgi:predicted ATPase